MADAPKSLYQRLLERRRALEGGDPTGDVQAVQKGKAKGTARAVQSATSNRPKRG